MASEYTLTDGNADYQFYCEESLQQGACVVLEGDMGQGKVRMFDIETWMPSRDAYYLAYPEHSAGVPKVKAFVNWMMEHLDDL